MKELILPEPIESRLVPALSMEKKASPTFGSGAALASGGLILRGSAFELVYANAVAGGPPLRFL